MLACLQLAFLSFVQFCMLVLLLLALYMPYNMISSPLCVITCFASFCACYACFVLPCAGFFAFFCIFAYLFMCSCICLCVLIISAIIVPTYNLVQVQILLYTQNLESLLRSLLDDTRVVCTPIYWNYRHQIKTYICPLRTPFIVCFFDNMLVCSFSCFLSFAYLPYLFAWCFLYLFVYLFCLSTGFVFSLFVVCKRLERGHNFQNAS